VIDHHSTRNAQPTHHQHSTMSQLEKFTTYTPEAARKARSEESGAG